jgi:hypothetical protein
MVEKQWRQIVVLRWEIVVVLFLASEVCLSEEGRGGLEVNFTHDRVSGGTTLVRFTSGFPSAIHLQIIFLRITF